MKRKSAILGLSLALALSGLWSCEKGIDETDKIEAGNTVNLTLKSDLSDQTRTSISYDETSGKYKPAWEAEEHIGTFVGENSNKDFMNSGAGQSTQFIGEVSLTAGTYKVYTYYPYDGKTSSSNTPSDTRIELPSVQKPTLESFDGAADIMVGYPLDLTLSADEDTPILEGLRFKRLMATLKIVPSDIASQVGSEPVTRVRLTAGEATLTGRVKIDLENCKIHDDGFYSSGNYKCNYAEAQYDAAVNFQLDGNNAAFLVVNPTTVAAGQTLTLEIETANYKITKTATLSSEMSLAAGEITPLRMNLGNGTTIESTSTGIDLPFEEDFASCTLGSNTSSSSGTTWSGNDNFSVVKTAYQAGEAVRLGKGGTLTTVKLNLSEPFTVIVKGKGWAADENVLTVSVNGQTKDCTYTSYMGTGDWESTYLYFDAATAASQVTFSTATDTRVFIDEISIQTGKVTPPAELEPEQTEITNIAAAGVTDATLKYTVNFDDDVKATCDGTVVTSATAAGGSVTYTVSENTDESERTGWIELASESTGLSVRVTVAQVGANTAATYTATYIVTSTSAVAASGDVPEGSSATFKNTYSTKDQLTAGKSATLTLSGYAETVIKSVVLSMHSNGKAGSGSYSILVGSNSIAQQSTAAFNQWDYNDSYGTSYRDIDTHATATEVGDNEDITITIEASVNSLFIQSYTITYEYASVGPKISASNINEVPAKGVTDATATYTAKNFTDDVSVSAFTGNVTSATAAGGIITYSVAPNYTGDVAEGTITLSSASAPEVTVKVSQLADEFTVTPAEIVLGGTSGSTKTFTVTSTYAWTASAAGSGYTVSPENGEAGTTEITVTATADGATEQQQLGTVTVTRTPDSKTAQVAVSQSAAGSVSEKTWTLVTDASTLASGDQITIAYYSGQAIAGNLSGKYLQKIDCNTFSEDGTAITELPTGALILTLGGETGAWTFANSDSQLLGATSASNNNLAFGSGSSTWKITISNGTATITNVANNSKLQYNSSKGSERFSNYKTGSQKDVQIFRLQ